MIKLKLILDYYLVLNWISCLKVIYSVRTVTDFRNEINYKNKTIDINVDTEKEFWFNKCKIGTQNALPFKVHTFFFSFVLWYCKMKSNVIAEALWSS